MNSVWFNVRRNFLIISFLTWGILISVYITLLMAGANAPMLFLLGVPGQAIIYLWSKIRTSDKN